jgi:hypothetical protein
MVQCRERSKWGKHATFAMSARMRSADQVHAKYAPPSTAVIGYHGCGNAPASGDERARCAPDQNAAGGARLRAFSTQDD